MKLKTLQSKSWDIPLGKCYARLLGAIIIIMSKKDLHVCDQTWVHKFSSVNGVPTDLVCVPSGHVSLCTP
jgi:hypothetical protein